MDKWRMVAGFLPATFFVCEVLKKAVILSDSEGTCWRLAKSLLF